MVEIKSEENNTVQLPNNIRQVGTPGEKICDDVSESDDGREACSSKSSTSSW